MPETSTTSPTALDDRSGDASSLAASMPFAAACGIEILEAAPDQVAGRLAWAPERCTVGGVLHGGALMALADSLGGLCAFLNLPVGATTSTIESKTNFMRGVRAGHVEGRATPLHTGRSTVVVQTELRDGAGTRVGHTIQTQAVIMTDRPDRTERNHR